MAASVFPPGISFSQAPGSGLITPGKASNRVECRRPLFSTFPSFWNRVFTEEVKEKGGINRSLEET